MSSVQAKVKIFESRNGSNNPPNPNPNSNKKENKIPLFQEEKKPPQQIQQKISKFENGSNNKNIIKNEQANNKKNNFPKDFDDYLLKIKKIKHPAKDCKKIDQIKENGKILDIYHYTMKSKLTFFDHSITIIFVGQSGAGKSTLINAYANFLLGVNYDQPCRYKIIIGNKEKEKDQTKSQTEEITMYKIKSPLYPGIIFKLIDTPGFADTENKDTGSKVNQNEIDKKHLNRFEDFFNNKLIEEEKGLLLGICFVVKASENRVTNFQKLIISSVLNLFGKNVGSNFLALLTHSDTDKSDAINVLTKEIEIFRKKEEQKKIWHWSLSSIKYFELIEKKQRDIGSFNGNIEDFISFTNEIINLPVIDLTLTKKNLHLKKSLNELKKGIKEEQLDILLKSYKTLQESKKRLNEQIKECNKKQEELMVKKAELNNKKTEKKKIDNKIESLGNAIERSNTEIQKFNKEIEKHKTDLKNISNILSDLENKMKENEKTKNDLNIKKDKAEKEMKEIEEKIKNSSNQNSSKDNIEQLKKALFEKQNTLKNLEEDICSINADAIEMEKEITDNKTKKDGLNITIDNIEIAKNSIEKNNKINRQDSSTIQILNDLISNLEDSKKRKKAIYEPYDDYKLINSDVRCLRCENCKKNCHVNCNCNWGLFFLLGKSWWCNNINKDGTCKLCECEYSKHERECKCYKHEQKERPKEVGLNAKEIKEIDNKISEIKKKIDNEKELKKKLEINEKITHDNEKKFVSLESQKNITNTKIVDEQKKIRQENKFQIEKKKQLDKEKNKQNVIEKEVNSMENTVNLINQIYEQYNNEKKRLEEENKKIEKTIESIEKETIKQIIKMKIISEEISKIEMKNEKTQSFDKQLEEIYKDNEYFIKNSEQFEPLKKKINEKLGENEGKILREFGIKKDDLFNIKTK